MATISFANLDQHFDISNVNVASFIFQDAAVAGFEYSYSSADSSDWEFDGAGITTSGGTPTGGTVDAIQVDFDNDNEAAPEIAITGLGGVAATSFGIGVGTQAQQRDAFWRAALGGHDTFNFTLSSYSIDLEIAGDGSTIGAALSGAFGGEDTFVTGGTFLSGVSRIVGDFFVVSDATATGANDQFTVGAATLVGDFMFVGGAGASVFGGADTLSPSILDDISAGPIIIAGDAHSLSDGSLQGGHDVINLTSTNVTGISTTQIYIIGDVVSVSGSGVAIGGDDTIYGSSLGDAIWGDDNSSSANMTGGNDWLFGEGGDDTIDGQSGNDVIRGGAGADYLIGGVGLLDRVDYSDAVAAGVNVNLGTNSVTGDIATGDTISGFEMVLGSNFADTIVGETGVDNFLYGEGGGDSIDGLSGHDWIFGGAGSDTLVGGNGFDFISGGADADNLDGGDDTDILDYTNDSAAVIVNLATLTASGGSATGDTIAGFENVYTGSGADSLTGDGANNHLFSNTGADTMWGGGGDDTLDGGDSGADALNGEAGNDVLYANLVDSGSVLDGGADNDTLFGDSGADQLIGGLGVDSLVGSSGADTLTGGDGADILDGGADADTASYADATGAVTVNLNSGTVSGDIAQGDVLSSIENVAGGNFNDVLTGAHGVANWLSGGFGADNINGFSGNDTILGGGGNDTLTGNFGVDNLDGGAGIDLANYSDATARVVVRLWNGTGEGNLAQGDVLANIENLQGSNFNDILFGADGVANWLGGGNGPDYLNGLSGNDTLVGGAGNDSLAGGSGADRLDFSAGSGADRVFNMITGAGVFDVIRITGYGAALDSFAEILAATTQVGADAVINLGGGNTITLVGTLKTSLVADDFTFV